MELRNMTDQAATDQVTTVDLASLLEELRIVVESSLDEQGVALRLAIDPALPAVWAAFLTFYGGFVILFLIAFTGLTTSTGPPSRDKGTAAG